jgi:hypothetical protein
MAKMINTATLNPNNKSFWYWSLAAMTLFTILHLSECGGGDPWEEEKHNRRNGFHRDMFPQVQDIQPALGLHKPRL